MSMIEEHRVSNKEDERRTLSVLECEIIVHRTDNVQIDEAALHEILRRKRKETLSEISSLVQQ
jgi:hypothetical protein